MKIKHLITSIITLMLLAWAAWLWLLPWGVSEYTRSVLAEQGVVLQHLSLGDIAWEGCQIHDLRLRDADQRVSIQAQQINIHYHIPSLLKGDITALDVHVRRLAVKHASTASDTPTESIALSSPLPLLTMIPLSRIRIDALRIQQYQQQVLVHDLQGTLDAQPGRIHLQLSERHDTLFRGMQGSFDMADNGDIYGDIHRQEQPLAVLQGNVHNDQGQLQLHATATMQLAPLSQWLKPRMMNAPLSATGSSTLTIKAHAPAGDYHNIAALLAVLDVQLEAQYDGAIKHPQLSAKGKFTGKISLHHGQGHWSLTPKASFSVRQATWHGQTGAHHLSGGIRVDDKLTPLLTLDNNSYLQWRSLRYDTWRLDGLRLKNKQRMPLNGAQAWKRMQLNVTLPPLQWQGYKIRSTLMEITAKQLKKGMKAQLTLHDFSLHHTDITLPQGDVMMDITWQEDLQAQLRYRFSPQYTWLFKTHWQPSDNSATVKFDVQLDQPEAQITRLYPSSSTWFTTLKIPAGHIHSTGNVRLNRGQWRSQAKVNVRRLKGSYGDKTFNGVRANLQATFDGAIWRVKQADMDMAELNIGIPLHNIQLRSTARYRAGSYFRGHIQHAELKTLGGQISADNVSVDSKYFDNKQGISFPLNIQGVSLAELVALEKQQGLEATGVLDGTLPMRVQRQGVSVQQGNIAARQPGGLIRYSGEEQAQAMASKNPAIKLALDILQDFQYHHLSSDVTYHPDGKLLLGLHIKGKNPTYDGGRPVELNIQVQENILTLLKSLNLADEIGNQIQRKVSN